jgi:tripartite-type tricarboxylate transporter receptor subunit TctC
MTRRLALAVLVAMLPALAPAQDRGKPIRVIVATGVGGTADVFMRCSAMNITGATAGPSSSRPAPAAT